MSERVTHLTPDGGVRLRLRDDVSVSWDAARCRWLVDTGIEDGSLLMRIEHADGPTDEAGWAQALFGDRDVERLEQGDLVAMRCTVPAANDGWTREAWCLPVTYWALVLEFSARDSNAGAHRELAREVLDGVEAPAWDAWFESTAEVEE